MLIVGSCSEAHHITVTTEQECSLWSSVTRFVLTAFSLIDTEQVNIGFQDN